VRGSAWERALGATSRPRRAGRIYSFTPRSARGSSSQRGAAGGREEKSGRAWRGRRGKRQRRADAQDGAGRESGRVGEVRLAVGELRDDAEIIAVARIRCGRRIMRVRAVRVRVGRVRRMLVQPNVQRRAGGKNGEHRHQQRRRGRDEARRERRLGAAGGHGREEMRTADQERQAPVTRRRGGRGGRGAAKATRVVQSRSRERQLGCLVPAPSSGIRSGRRAVGALHTEVVKPPQLSLVGWVA